VVFLFGFAVLGIYKAFFKTHGETEPTNPVTKHEKSNDASQNEDKALAFDIPQKISLTTNSSVCGRAYPDEGKWLWSWEMTKNKSVHFTRVDGIENLNIANHRDSSIDGFVKGSVYVVDSNQLHDNHIMSDLPEYKANLVLFQVKDSGILKGTHWILATSKSFFGINTGKLDDWNVTHSIETEQLYTCKVAETGAPVPVKRRWQPIKSNVDTGKDFEFLSEEFGKPTFIVEAEN